MANQQFDYNAPTYTKYILIPKPRINDIIVDGAEGVFESNPECIGVLRLQFPYFEQDLLISSLTFG